MVEYQMNNSDLKFDNIREYGESLAGFINRSPSPYHASRSLTDYLESEGFQRLDETDEWSLEPAGKYYVTRNDTSLIAFRNGQNPARSVGIRAIGAHLDSPCLKLTPESILNQHGYHQLNVEVYGSALVRTWFDRDLSIAGRVYFRKRDNGVGKCLIDARSPVAVIPSIAIHLEREANTNQKINNQTHLNPVFAAETTNNSFSLEKLLAESDGFVESGYDGGTLLGHDLCLYDTNGPVISGLNGEFISSARIDNLLSCHAGVNAIANAETDNFCLLVCSDHEEVGSVSDAGAGGSFLASVLERTVGLDSTVIRRSMLLSTDGAHGIHPNYPQKHDGQHAPVLNHGLVIKVNANQSYASTGESIALIRSLCEELQIPCQVFVSRNDMRCGSTIGPIVASEIGIKTVDIGVAQFAMHSVRELAGVKDGLDFTSLLNAFLESETTDISEWVEA